MKRQRERERETPTYAFINMLCANQGGMNYAFVASGIPRIK